MRISPSGEVVFGDPVSENGMTSLLGMLMESGEVMFDLLRRLSRGIPSKTLLCVIPHLMRELQNSYLYFHFFVLIFMYLSSNFTP